jgi:hypothetical protein
VAPTQIIDLWQVESSWLEGLVRAKVVHTSLAGSGHEQGIVRRIIEARDSDVFLNTFRSRRHQVVSPINMAIGRPAISVGSGMCLLNPNAKGHRSIGLGVRKANEE